MTLKDEVAWGTKHLGLLLMLAALLFSLDGARWSAFAIADACLYGLLFLCIWQLKGYMQGNLGVCSNAAALLAISPFLNNGFALVSVGVVFAGGGWLDWQNTFANIRVYDDAALPCLFLLWQRPGWLARSRLKPFVLLLSFLYMFTFWQDGARAVLLSVFVALLAIAYLRKSWELVKMPFLVSLGSGLSFYATEWLFSAQMNSIPLLRATSSRRWELWQSMIQAWWQRPLTGIGGDHFGRLGQPIISMHPHNIVLQWVGEYGIFGLMVLLVAIVLIWRLIKEHGKLPIFAVGALISIGINCLFSGVFIYPLSQAIIVWVFAWSLAHSGIFNTNVRESERAPYSTSTYIFRAAAALVLIGVWSIHHGDFFSGSSSEGLDSVRQPRFWQHGQILNLP